MKITFKEWSLFILAAVLGFFIWLRFAYPQFTFVDLSIDKGQAQAKACALLKGQGIDTDTYSKAVVFSVDSWGDRYLQKTLGFGQEEAFIKKHDYELFHWRVRFFKPFQKEEFSLLVSASTGEILNFRHLIEDVARRPSPDKEAAKEKAKDFLRSRYKIDFNDYDFHEEKIKRFENRVDYGFSWEKKDVYVPWKIDQGGAKLLIGATVSGDEIREFYKSSLDIPEKFRRTIENQLAFGEYLFSFYFLVYIFAIIWSVWFILKRRQHQSIRSCKKWFLSLAVFLTIVNGVAVFNNIQSVLIHYPTSLSLGSFIGVYLLREAINVVFLSFVFILPGLAGESLRLEVWREKPYSGFVHYLRTTFLSRSVSRSIALGYVLFFIILGLQAGLFTIGHRTLGVWKEWTRLAQFSSAYLPFLSAFAVGLTASFSEEATFRLFGISLGKKYLKNTALAVFLSSLIWGMGHSAYAIFPVWFRILEVGILGLVYGFIFVKYGLIPLLTAHYLFDVFFGVAGHLLGRTTGFLFWGSSFILAIPLFLALVSYVANREEREEDQEAVAARLGPIQRFNLEVLRIFVSAKKAQGHSRTAVQDELVAHDWDAELVDLAVKQVFGG